MILGKSQLSASGPFVRYYYPLEKIYPFAEAEAIFGSCKESVDDGDEETYPIVYVRHYLSEQLCRLVTRVTFDEPWDIPVQLFSMGRCGMGGG